MGGPTVGSHRSTTTRRRSPPPVLEAHVRGDVEGGQAVAGDLGPFDERDAVGAELLAEEVGLLVAEALGETEQVEVGHRHAAVLVPARDRERRARDRDLHPERAARAADEGRLAGAELARDEDDVARAQRPRQVGGDRLGLRRGGRLGGDGGPSRSVRHGKGGWRRRQARTGHRRRSRWSRRNPSRDFEGRGRSLAVIDGRRFRSNVARRATASDRHAAGARGRGRRAGARGRPPRPGGRRSRFAGAPVWAWPRSAARRPAEPGSASASRDAWLCAAGAWVWACCCCVGCCFGAAGFDGRACVEVPNGSWYCESPAPPPPLWASAAGGAASASRRATNAAMRGRAGMTRDGSVAPA